MALMTAAQYREHYPQLTGTGADVRLGTLIDRADSLMAAFCGFPVPDGATRRTLEESTYTVYPGPSALQPRALELGVYPVTDLTSVHRSSSWVYDASSLVSSDDYVLDAARGQVWLKPNSSASDWIREPRAQKAVLTAGFVTPLDTGHDLIAICAALVHHLLQQGHTQGRRAVSAGGANVTFDDAAGELIPPPLQVALGQYVLWGSRAG